jgi:hypothetical protein
MKTRLVVVANHPQRSRSGRRDEVCGRCRELFSLVVRRRRWLGRLDNVAARVNLSARIENVAE